MQSITSVVAERIAGSSEAVAQNVIDHLVNKEVARRTEAVIAGLAQLDKLTKEHKKLKPDVVSYSGDGSIASQSWSKAAIDAFTASDKKISKLSAAIEKALGGNDFSDLFNLSNAAAPTQG